MTVAFFCSIIKNVMLIFCFNTGSKTHNATTKLNTSDYLKQSG